MGVYTPQHHGCLEIVFLAGTPLSDFEKHPAKRHCGIQRGLGMSWYHSPMTHEERYIKIEPAKPEEASEILRLTQAAFALHAKLLDPPSSVFQETEEDVLRAMRDGVVLVARCEGRLAGAARLLPLPEQQALICGRLAVDPPMHGRGVGTALMEAFERYAAAEEYAAAVVGVRIQLEGNLRFFAKRGYRQISEHSHPGYTTVTYVRLRKNLTFEVATP
jgi:predicted N-acetyltransferase YhbS